jgi:hypothetical protein
MLGARKKAQAVAAVYGAALAASTDEGAAARVAAEVLRTAGQVPVTELRARAVLLALRDVPAPCFAAMQQDDRAAVGLARLLGMSVRGVAETLGIDDAEARARMSAGLRALAPERALAVA